MQIKLKSVSEYGGEVLITDARLCWVRMTPQKNLNDDTKATRSVTIMLPKKGFDKKAFEDIVKQVVKASSKAGNEKAKATIFQKAVKIHADGSLLKDGDRLNEEGEKTYDYIAGHYLLRAKQNLSLDKNGDFVAARELDVRNPDKSPMPESFWAKEIYSGVVCHVAVALSVYNVPGNAGVTCYLNGIMKVSDAERFGAVDMWGNIPPAASTTFDVGSIEGEGEETLPF